MALWTRLLKHQAKTDHSKYLSMQIPSWKQVIPTSPMDGIFQLCPPWRICSQGAAERNKERLNSPLSDGVEPHLFIWLVLIM
jgi:hypothetical protein